VSKAVAGILFVVLLTCAVAEAASSFQSELNGVLRRKPDLVAGEQQYLASCSGCHGEAGLGQPDGWAPRLAGQRYAVIASELVGYRRGRRSDVRMQEKASGHVLPEAQHIADVAAYAAQLAGGAAAQGPGNALELGEQLYAKRCRSCHGEDALGNDRSVVPRLAAQNYAYLARQLRDFVEGRRPVAARDHLQQLKSLDRDQLTGLADYLSRLP
jgi:cytochrome c553